jgi:hypothetical protein
VERVSLGRNTQVLCDLPVLRSFVDPRHDHILHTVHRDSRRMRMVFHFNVRHERESISTQGGALDV